MVEDRNAMLRFVHHWPTRIICVAIIMLQSASINWYLMYYIDYTWAAVFAGDVVVIILFAGAIWKSARSINDQKHTHNLTASDVKHLPLTYISWFVYSILISIKIGVIFTTISTDLDEDDFFGPNTLKTSLALSAIIFVSFLSTQHDCREGMRKNIVSSLTVTVIFDILDGVDNLENLFDKDVRDSFPPGLADTIIGICCINFILPTIPLFTLAFVKFGLRKMPKRFEVLHKLLIAYAVNLPMFITRMITWHGLSQGISIFVLKNLIAMGITAFEMLEDCLVRHGDKTHSSSNGASYALE